MSKTPVRGLNQYGVTLDDNQIVNGIKTYTQAPRLIVGQDEEYVVKITTHALKV